MNTQEKIQKVEKKIRHLLNEMGSESSAGQILNNHTLFKMYTERLEELKKQLK